ncbi:MAG: 3'-5' exonuclease [Lachnospiraceae bacterium]|nr:3'-5' exonuclease [Lachnospiraceae bacterium]
MALLDLLKNVEKKSYANIKFANTKEFYNVIDADNRKEILQEIGLEYKRFKREKELYYKASDGDFRCDVIGLMPYINEESCGCTVLIKLRKTGECIAINLDSLLEMQSGNADEGEKPEESVESYTQMVLDLFGTADASHKAKELNLIMNEFIAKTKVYMPRYISYYDAYYLPKKEKDTYYKLLAMLNNIEEEYDKQFIENISYKEGCLYVKDITLDDYLEDTIIAFDTETNGGNKSNKRIIQIGAVKFVKGEIVDRFESLVNSTDYMNPIAQGIHHISLEMLKTASSEEQVIREFVEFLDKNRNIPIVTFNGRSCDMPLLKETIARLGYNGIINHVDLYHDIKYISRYKINTKTGKYTQSDVAECYGIDVKNAHSALDDAIVCGKIYYSIKNGKEPVMVEVDEEDVEVNLSDLNTQQVKLVHSCMPNIDGLLRRKEEELNMPEGTLSYTVSISQAEKRKGQIASIGLFINEEEYPRVRPDKPVFKHGDIVIRFMPEPSSFVGKTYMFYVQRYKIRDTKISIGEDKSIKSDKLYNHYRVNVDDENIESFLNTLLDYSFKNYKTSAKPFGCCSKYKQCSDARRCLHCNLLYATACQYRKNLEAGKIYY